MVEEVSTVEILDNHEKRITKLENDQTEIISRITNIEKGQLTLENTVLKEFSSSKDMLRDQKNMADTLLAHVLNVNKTQQEVKGQVELTKIAAEKDVKVAKLSRSEKIIVALLSAPGLFLAGSKVIQYLF